MSKEEKVLKENRIFKGRILEFYNDDVLCANNVVTTREYIKHPGGVCILGFIDGKIPLVKQYRYALQKELLELPAGKLEKGENPEVGAIREYEEEVGYKVLEIQKLGSIIPTCGYSNEVIHLFYAKKLQKTHTNFDIDESIDICLYPLDEVLKMIDDGKIIDAKTIAVIYHYLRLNKWELQL